MAAPGISELFRAIISAVSPLQPRSVLLQPPPPHHHQTSKGQLRLMPIMSPFLQLRKELVIAFCIGSALEIAHKAQSRSHDQLPSTCICCCALQSVFPSPVYLSPNSLVPGSSWQHKCCVSELS
ncbi:hypothetical protein PVL29_022029 [Vitis rotundifolia]|uniref:Uncharacterized protein n=1 Tax=Vitis rotundifolia TaxID=103349 RepID=A0AA39DAM9_VITRO|nr:hypothetical protein PVL29_022029 [Vitis rotundifolia]